MSVYAEAEAMLAEPAYIKCALPIAYVAEKAGVRMVAGEGRLHGLCPFHQDSNPSFDIYPWGQGERFGCFSCGAGGDVLDFIMMLWRKDFRSACEMAKRGIAALAAEGWTAPTLGAVFEWDEAAAEDLLSRAGTEGLETIIAAKDWCFPASHLRAWGCRVQGSELLVPVRSENGALVGVKHRPLSGARSLISLPGSRLRWTLYGAHLGLRPTVLLVEGESDAWTASWHTRDISALSVLSLPAGCGAAPGRLDLLGGRGVIIALDGDEAGQMSAARWMDAVGTHGALLPLPLGEDITSLSSTDPGWLLARLREFGAY